MLHETALIAGDRRMLYAWTRQPEGQPRGVVAHVHGMGEHSRRYDHLTAIWAAHGYVSAGFDLRGHGRSEGARGHTPSYGQLLDDVATFLESLDDQWGDLPLTLYGHSMGGNLVLNYALQRRPPAIAVVASAPYLRLACEPSAWRLRLAGLLKRIAPTTSFKTGIERAALSRDPAVIDAYLADPLIHDRISASFFAAVHAAGEAAIMGAPATTLPTLVMHGSADRITSPAGSAAYVDRAAGHAALRVWDGFYHELHNEPGWQEVADFVLLWMNRVQR
jgi:alpha-beta hydrolase superfamily lysophospholipase